MKTKKLLLLVILSITSIISKANSDSTQIFFEQSYDELKNMLEGKQALNFERAVFISENPYLDNKISFIDFSSALDAHLYLIKELINVNDRADSKDFSTTLNVNNPKFDISSLKYTETEKKELYRRTLANWAIFKYITDTTQFYNFLHFPFSYQIADPFGMRDWKNSQVINLLSSENQKGNCLALTFLFKIFSERLNSKAYICTAPQHIYIQHQDDKGDYYNVELASHSHPGDGSIQTLTYTYYEAIANGIALRRLNQVQDIALCLVNLGKSYERKFQNKDDKFILQCADLALEFDSLNLNAMLLREEVLEERVTKYIAQKNISNFTALTVDKDIAVTFANLENQIIRLYYLGYHQMPMYMQQMILNALKREDNQPVLVQDRTPNPFTSIDVSEKDKRYSTLSRGVFEEVHEKKQFEEYGHLIFDTDKRKIIKIDTAKDNEFLIDPVAFAWSVDPLSHDYPGWSPYASFNDNPVLFDDPTGKSGEVSIDKETKTVTVTSNLVLYGGAASPELAKSTANDIQNEWNAAAGKVSIDGVEYNVKFNVTGTYKPDLTPDEVAKNTDIKNNYFRVEETVKGNISFTDKTSPTADPGGNTGYFKLGNIKADGSTTEAHEFGHGWGLVKGAGKDGHPLNLNLIGKGQPGIMYPRGTLVDPQYRYNNWKQTGYNGLDPDKRAVTQGDIQSLGIDKLNFDTNGKANLGTLTNQYHLKTQ